LKPYLIPRLNYDFSLKDFVVGMKGLFKKNLRVPELEKLFDSNNIFFLNHARSCLQLFLEALELPPGSKIGVQVFNCDTVFRSITNAGYQPLFLDINDNFNIDINDLNSKLNEIKALIVTHTFGFPADIKKIKYICGNIPIIEDCAHSFLSRVDGKLTGTFGDASIFSYGNAKFPSIGEGGWMLINSNKYLNNFSEKYLRTPSQGILLQILSSFKNLFLNMLYNKYIYKFFTRPFKNHFFEKLDFTGKTDSKIFKPNKIYFYLLSEKMKHINAYLALQQKNAKFVINSIDPIKMRKVEIEQNVEPNYFMIPFIVSNPQAVIEIFFNNGIEIGQHFKNSINWAFQYGYKKNCCENAEILSIKYLTFPTYHSLAFRNLNSGKSLKRTSKLETCN